MNRIQAVIQRRSVGSKRLRNGLAILTAIALGMSAFSGCGKSDPRFQAWGGMSKEEWLAQYKQRKEQEQAEEQAAQQAAEAKKKEEAEAAAARARKPRSAPKAKGPDPNRSLEGDEPPPAPAPVQPQSPPPQAASYPADFSEWTMEHFERAWNERSERLHAAIASLGTLHVGDPTAAEKLARLMDLRSQGGKGASGKAADAEDALYLRGIITALLRNRTAAAERVLLRSWQEAVDRRDADAAKIILESIFGESDAASGHVFTAVADDLARLSVTADSEWASAAVGGALTLAAAPVRQAIWNRLSTLPDSPLRRTVLAVLTRAEEANVQLLLDVIATLPPEAQAEEWRRAVEWSNAQWRSLLEGRRSDSPYQLVSVGAGSLPVLWSEEVAEKACRALDRVVFLRESEGTVAFAGALPRPEIRAALSNLLRRRWSEPPQGVFASVEYSDPGLIVVLKSVLREHQDSAVIRYGPRSVATAPQTSGAAPVRRPREMPVAPIVAAQGKVRWEYQAWLDETYALIDRWMNRLAEGGVLDRRRPWDAGTLLDFAVHSEDCPGYAVSLLLSPAQPSEADSAKAPSAEVGYVRLADRARPATVVSHYRKVLPTARERPLPNGLWLEYVSADGNGLWTSVDIRITAVDPTQPAQGSQDLFVEILRIKAGVALPEKEAAAAQGASGS